LALVELNLGVGTGRFDRFNNICSCLVNVFGFDGVGFDGVGSGVGFGVGFDGVGFGVVFGGSGVGASVFGASVFGVSVFGASVFGASVFGASVFGASVFELNIFKIDDAAGITVGVALTGGSFELNIFKIDDVVVAALVAALFAFALFNNICSCFDNARFGTSVTLAGAAGNGAYVGRIPCGRLILFGI